MRGDRGSLAGRLMATAAGIALVAVAIGLLVHVIVSVWVPLVIIASCVLAVVGAIGFFRRTRGW